ncbi:MAG: hypothetical protein KGP28_07780 [Bdellovibrionales bacterium]|nr:hypothetical protein [Bdellovibrionales bacterium]
MSFVEHQVIRVWIASVLTVGFLSLEAQALDFDWQGQFRAETNTIFGYSNAPSTGTSGYSVPLRGDSPANFQNLFLSLKPRVLVNDNVSIFGDLWFNSPDQGLFGSNPLDGAPRFSNTVTGNGLISARAFFAEVATDFGTFRVGRMPLQYGLGLVWNSDSSRRSRLPSFGDAMTLVTKLGAFKFSPIFVKYQQQRGVVTANSGITDYALNLSYSNDDEQLDVGLLFLRRLAGSNAGVTDPLSFTSGTSGYGYNLWDFYAKKKSGIFTLEAEVPIASGLVASKSFSSVAGAVKAKADLSEQLSLKANVGSASGQASTPSPDKFTAFYFHPDYRPGLLMFNYNYRNIASGSGSFFDNPITNARFLSLSGQYMAGKFSHEVLGLFAMADQVANGSGKYFNTLSGSYQDDGGSSQEKGLGFELDYSLGYDWDEYTRFGIDTGLYFPGAFYKFSAGSTPNDVKTVFGAQFGMTVKF